MGGASSKKAKKEEVADGPLSNSEINKRLTGSVAAETFRLEKENVGFRYAVVSQRGYYPDSKTIPPTWQPCGRHFCCSL
jgi:hypothetical protein